MLACVLLPAADAALSRRLFAVSPSVECDGACAFLDLRGLERLHRNPAGVFAAIRAALAPQVPVGLALAGNRFTAEAAARHGRGPVTVRAGEEAAFLAHLPLTALPLARALAQRLLPLGLRTLGDFASLPRAAVERRYGAEGVALHRLACGADARALLPQREPRALRVLQALEFPADRLSLLLPALEQALALLCGWVREEGDGLVQLLLTLTLDRGLAADEESGAAGAVAGAGVAEHTGGVIRTGTWELSLPEPEARTELLLDLLRLKLEAAPPGAPVTDLALQALRRAPLAAHQNTLFGEVARDAARRAEVLARLRTLFGERTVARPQLVRAHCLERRWHCLEQRGQGLGQRGQGPQDGPASPRDEPVSLPETAAPLEAPAPAHAPALRLLAEPEELVTITTGGALAAFRRGRRELRVARLSGPRRLCGGWWKQPWERDEYELLTDDGALYRVCRDTLRRRWLLLAEVD